MPARETSPPSTSAPAPSVAPPRAPSAFVVTAVPALVVPAMLAFNLPPSATFLNQAAALIGWGGFALVLAASAASATAARHGGRLSFGGGLRALFAALALLAASALGAALFAGLTWGLAASALGIFAAAGLVVAVAAASVQRGQGDAAFQAFCIALIAAGVASTAVAVVQVFAPTWADGNWIAATALVGRASGNLRQPNHLSSLLLWSVIAALWLGEAGHLRRGWAAGLGALFVFALVLSGSRTGTLGVVILGVWGVFDRRLSRHTRAALLAAPLLYALFWFGLTAWAHHGHAALVDERRFSAEGDISASRFGIWANTLALIAQHPWFGVGWGEFNFAWTLTPFPGRPVAFFDHTHNLLLQFAVELGLPLAALVLALLLFALWRAFAAGRLAADPSLPDQHSPAWQQALLLRAAFMMVLMIALHSQLEYPLWYAYFLLPTAFAFGLCLGADGAPVPSFNVPTNAPAEALSGSGASSRPLVLAALVLTGGGALSVIDYARVVAIFQPGDGAAPLAARIAAGQHSVFFSHHADYAAATTAATAANAAGANAVDNPNAPKPSLAPFAGASRYLLDTRLMMAWADALNANGDTERARFIAQRLREFRNPDSAAYFEPCDLPDPEIDPSEPLPYQCAPPTRSFDYRDFDQRDFK